MYLSTILPSFKLCKDPQSLAICRLLFLMNKFEPCAFVCQSLLFSLAEFSLTLYEIVENKWFLFQNKLKWEECHGCPWEYPKDRTTNLFLSASTRAYLSKILHLWFPAVYNSWFRKFHSGYGLSPQPSCEFLSTTYYDFPSMVRGNNFQQVSWITV